MNSRFKTKKSFQGINDSTYTNFHVILSKDPTLNKNNGFKLPFTVGSQTKNGNGDITGPLQLSIKNETWKSYCGYKYIFVAMDPNEEVFDSNRADNVDSFSILIKCSFDSKI